MVSADHHAKRARLAIAALINGVHFSVTKPDHVLADHAALRAKIPAAIWNELKEQGVVHGGAPVLATPAD